MSVLPIRGGTLSLFPLLPVAVAITCGAVSAAFLGTALVIISPSTSWSA